MERELRKRDRQEGLAAGRMRQEIYYEEEEEEEPAPRRRRVGGEGAGEGMQFEEVREGGREGRGGE